MLQLEPLPDTIHLLSDPEALRLRNQHPDLPASPEHCVTCRGAKRFRWWAPGTDIVGSYECPCRDQWVLHRVLLYSGIGLGYARLGWGFATGVEGGAIEVVESYLCDLDAYVNNGVGLILHGNMGTGKTLLSVLLAKAALAQGVSVHFTTFSAMLRSLMAGFNDEDEMQWFHKRIKNVGLLVIDELGREHQQRFSTKEGVVDRTTALAQSTLDDVLRHRVAQAKPTLLTTNMELGQLIEGYGSNVMSLLSERSIDYRFTGADFRPQERRRVDEEIRLRLQRPLVIR